MWTMSWFYTVNKSCLSPFQLLVDFAKKIFTLIFFALLIITFNNEVFSYLNSNCRSLFKPMFRTRIQPTMKTMKLCLRFSGRYPGVTQSKSQWKVYSIPELTGEFQYWNCIFKKKELEWTSCQLCSFRKLFTRYSTVFGIPVEVDQQETLKITYKSYDLDLVWNI